MRFLAPFLGQGFGFPLLHRRMREEGGAPMVLAGRSAAKLEALREAARDAIARSLEER